MKLGEAQSIANHIRESMAPYCLKVEVGGSIRREVPEVKDIEIIASPRWTEVGDPADLFGETRVRSNTLYRGWAKGNPNFRVREEPCPSIQWIKPGTAEIIPWSIKEDGNYWRGIIHEYGIKVDIFMSAPTNWGAVLLVRTGHWSFGREIVTWAKKVGYCFDKAGVWSEDLTTNYEVPEEAQVFELLGLEYVEPKDRTGPEAVIPIRARPKRT